MKEDQHMGFDVVGNDMEVKALRRKGIVYTIDLLMGRQIAPIHYTERLSSLHTMIKPSIR